MAEQKYAINVGDFEASEDNGTIYPDRCLSASIGGGGVPSDTIPWADTQYNPWDYKALYIEKKGVKYYTGEFELDIIVIPTPTPTPSQLDIIEAQLTYTALKTDTLLGG